MRKKILAANWKMNHGVEETQKFFQEFNRHYHINSEIEVVIAPSYLSLQEAVSLNAKKISIAAQNMHWAEKGAFTGEVSVSQIKEAKCTHVILGHSERRHVFHETDEEIQKKVALALTHQMQVILCVGETLEERNQEKTHSVLERQVGSALSVISGAVTIAYEPVWAIGTGQVATPQQAEEAHQSIRKMVWDRFGMDAASNLGILYGGSVKPDNISNLISQPNIDGALVGGASLDPKTFLEILNQMA